MNFFFYFGLIFVPTQMTDVNSILVRFQKSRKLASLSGLRGTPSSLALIRWQFVQVVFAGSSRLSQEVVTVEEVDWWSATSHSYVSNLSLYPCSLGPRQCLQG